MVYPWKHFTRRKVTFNISTEVLNDSQTYVFNHFGKHGFFHHFFEKNFLNFDLKKIKCNLLQSFFFNIINK